MDLKRPYVTEVCQIEFSIAIDAIQTLKLDPGGHLLLKMYALELDGTDLIVCATLLLRAGRSDSRAPITTVVCGEIRPHK